MDWCRRRRDERQVLQNDGVAVPSNGDVRGGLIQMRAYLIWQAKPQGEAT